MAKKKIAKPVAEVSQHLPGGSELSRWEIQFRDATGKTPSSLGLKTRIVARDWLDRHPEAKQMLAEENKRDLVALEALLEEHIQKKRADLPAELRERLAKGLNEMVWEMWDSLPEEERRKQCEDWIERHHPALEAKRVKEWDECTVGWYYWQKVSSLTAQEFCILRHVHDPRKFDDDQNCTPGGEGKTLGERVSDDVRIIERAEGQNVTKPVKEWVSWAQKQSWELPSYLRALAEEGGDINTDQGASGNPCDVFLTMQNLTADEVSIAFVGDKTESGVGANNMLEISARHVTKRVALAALDLINRSNGSLNIQGGILLGMAYGNKLTHSNTRAQGITRLRRVFMKHLGIKAPFDPCRKGAGWEPRFKIYDKRGAADERAKREAERRTDSYEQMKAGDTNQTHQPLGSENDAADE